MSSEASRTPRHLYTSTPPSPNHEAFATQPLACWLGASGARERGKRTKRSLGGPWTHTVCNLPRKSLGKSTCSHSCCALKGCCALVGMLTHFWARRCAQTPRALPRSAGWVRSPARHGNDFPPLLLCRAGEALRSAGRKQLSSR